MNANATSRASRRWNAALAAAQLRDASLRTVSVCLSFLIALVMLGDQAEGASLPVDIAVVPVSDGLRVVYDLPVATTSLSLQIPRQPSPAINIRIEGEGFAFQDNQVKAARPFTRVSLIVASDHREVNSTYPMMLPVQGKGFVVYAPYLMPASGAARVKLVDGNGTTRTIKNEVLNGYLIVGAAPQDHGSYQSLVSAGAPKLLRETVLGRTQRLLSFYRSRLRKRPDQEPTIVVSYAERPQDAKGDFFRGDVAANGVVFLRIYSDAAAGTDPSMVARYTAFLGHELFHLWNRSNDAESLNWWLHEGGAEYASWIATSTLWPAEPPLEKRIGDALRTCMMFLGGRPLSSLSDPEAPSVRYPCGAVIQWIGDVGARANGRKRDGFAIWARLLTARKTAGSYKPRDFHAALAALAPQSQLPVEAILNGTGVDRWVKVANSLNAMRAQVDVNAPLHFFLRLAAARPIVLSACSEVWGVGESEKGLFVQAPQACTAFGDSPVIEEAQGIAPMRDANAFYKAVQLACAAGSEIALSLSANGTRRTSRVKCTVPVDPPPPDLKVLRALPAL